MRRLHSGQASVFVLAMVASLVTAFAVSFGAGQLVNDKMRLVNAADAAAYSAAQWEARSLNFQSYLNRAIVANEVAIAQLVSLRSWSSYVATLTQNGAAVARWIPPLAGPVQTLERGWHAVDSSLQAVAPGLEAGISAWNVDVLATAEALAHQQALLAAADLVGEVAHANEPRARVNEATRLLQVRNGAQWQNQFTDRYRRGGGDLRRFVDLLMKSRDGFTRSRRSGISVPLVRVARRGGTDLLAEHSWRGLDTLSVHVDLLVNSVEIPIGWGAAETRSRTVTQRGEHGGSLSSNPAASRRALRGLRPSGLYRGVPEIRDVITPSRQEERRLRYAVALQIPESGILTPDRLLMPNGVRGPDGLVHSLAVTMPAGGVHALGAAEVYFQRPSPRPDGRHEFPSLFSPYWQARLVAVTANERQLTAPGKGLTVDPYALLP
ncbi:MAG TPA: pilus assembly protein TadG-related protein [Steroidobacteraceae bacterium]|nr:pilus assembly protein TadG-related protein [Steroidobacteraceae bacterium]